MGEVGRLAEDVFMSGEEALLRPHSNCGNGRVERAGKVQTGKQKPLIEEIKTNGEVGVCWLFREDGGA